ncbi:MAG: HAMP domain-containing histidine kinase [Candidatus Nitricoxidivorans perseverans]|uniref:histidine kinase n=1 Tax=Candidatus Nitricoxidivorans perseverans TaxID=2975601 RepID=A0AA49J3C3_9PROT|nr:MAG: HAMP domain-containing histidine kinase [Candidatus Nitricoxidivorans perseverans]
MIPNTAAPFRHSLLVRLLATVFAALALGVAALFFGLDHFVSGQFSRLRSEQIVRASDEVRRLVDAEGARLVSLAALLAKDADLNNSTFYHLYLAGERDHPQAAVERIAHAFGFEAVSLWGDAGRIIAVSPKGTSFGASPAPTFKAAPRTDGLPASRLLHEDGHAWLVADAPLMREGNPIAVLRVARPLEKVLAAGLPALYPASLKVVDGVAASGATRIELPPVALELNLPDTVGEALAGAKAVLVVILLGGGVLLAVFLAIQLRWQLKPLAALSRASAAVGRGDFSQRVDAPGETEVARLARAFNAMTADLAQLRELERKVAHQEQLSAIGRVAARVAHDINNPLTVIANTAQLALKTPPADPQLAEDLRRIVHHGERCMRTLELLLDYGRPVRVQAAPLDLAALVREIGQRWKAAVVASDALPVEVDRLQIEQMLDNLLSNARDACGPDGVVTIEANSEAGQARLAITDSGPGFSPQARERLFEPFHTTKAGGTGLGLASALAIARAHGGNIELGEADAGVGGRVIVRLPLTSAAADQARPKVEAPR